jgi:hypothetical protein
MSFSVADVPSLVPDAFSGIFESVPPSPRAPQAEIERLTLMINNSVANAHLALNQILGFDLEWRTSVFKGETEYDAAIEERIEANLKLWADATDLLLTNLDKLKSRGFCPPSLDTLRPLLREVRSMLTPDDQFFEGEALDELTEGAIEQYERGQTVEFQVMGE